MWLETKTRVRPEQSDRVERTLVCVKRVPSSASPKQLQSAGVKEGNKLPIERRPTLRSIVFLFYLISPTFALNRAFFNCWILHTCFLNTRFWKENKSETKIRRIYLLKKTKQSHWHIQTCTLKRWSWLDQDCGAFDSWHWCTVETEEAVTKFPPKTLSLVYASVSWWHRGYDLDPTPWVSCRVRWFSSGQTVKNGSWAGAAVSGD